MDFNDYQRHTDDTAIYPDAGNGNFIYPALGLCGEAGEVAERIKKVLRDANGHMTLDRKTGLLNELGDVLWYVARLAREIGIPLDYIAEYNIKKLSSRKERNVLHGSGSNR